LWLGGDGLARGLLESSTLTAERRPDPFFQFSRSLLYRTGTGAVASDGYSIFRRQDDQSRSAATAFEPGEVEAAILVHPSDRAAVPFAAVNAKIARV